MAQLSAAVIVCNNPLVHGELFNPFKGERVQIEGYPSVKVRLEGLPAELEASVRLKVENAVGGVVLSRVENVTPEEHGASWEVRLDTPLEAPTRARLEVVQGEDRQEFVQEVRLHRMYGRITDFEGKPVRGYVCANGYSGLLVQADSKGDYEIWLPEDHIPALSIADQDYAHTSLEVWAYDYFPRHDLKLDARIGQIELYELQAWRGYAGLKLDFIPMSIGLGNRLAKALPNTNVASEEFLHVWGRLPDAKAFLNRTDVSVDLDGQPLKIEGFWERWDVMSGGEGERRGLEATRPEYTLQLSDAPQTRPRGRTQVLRVVVTRRHVEEGRMVEEKGEGYYLGLRCGWGVSGAGE